MNIVMDKIQTGEHKINTKYMAHFQCFAILMHIYFITDENIQNLFWDLFGSASDGGAKKLSILVIHSHLYFILMVMIVCTII
jgi:hypothetical protein